MERTGQVFSRAMTMITPDQRTDDDDILSGGSTNLTSKNHTRMEELTL